VIAGDVVLENLTINKNKLTTPELPIEVVQGMKWDEKGDREGEQHREGG
jgi:hypothetical protein